MEVQLIVAPIVREADGLALSSRNAYLSADERRQALVLHRALLQVETLANSGTMPRAKNCVRRTCSSRLRARGPTRTTSKSSIPPL